jgi:hypothetical protein
MHRTDSHTTKRLMTIALLAIVSALLVACGSSSKSTSTATAAAKTGAAAAGGPGGNRFAALRECLKKQGITLPQRSTKGRTGSGRPPAGGAGGFLLGGGGSSSGGGGAGFSQRLPKGVTRAQFEAAFKKCGGSARGRFGAGAGGAARLSSPAFKASLTKFAACMRQNGINVPTPNTSGKGPIFNTKGLDTTSTKFRTAQQKCSSLLALGGRPGAGGGAAGGYGAPGAGGGAAPGGAPGGEGEAGAPGGAPAG